MDIQKYSAVVAEGQNPNTTSDRYSFIPTTRVLGVLAEAGWNPYQVKQARVNKRENEGFQKHLIRLRHVDTQAPRSVGDDIPEICLFNSHGGTASFHLNAGLTVLACMNGLVVSKETYGDYRIRHVGYTDEKVSFAVTSIMKELPRVLAQRQLMMSVRMTHEARIDFALKAIALRFDSERYRVTPQSVLWVRHYQQRDETLWNTFNVVQENLVKGGVFQYRPNGTRIRSREVKNIAENTKLNQDLWALAESYVTK